MRLRAYFSIREPDGPWNTWLSQDLDGILEAWDSCSPSGQTTGVLHLGFQPLKADNLERIETRHKGDLLITESARHGLPAAFTSAIVSVGSASGLHLYRVEGGWGTRRTPGRHERPRSDYPNPHANQADSWLTDLPADNQVLKWSLKSVGIHDDRTYYKREWCLNTEIRRELGILRARKLGIPESFDPCLMARAAPPWLIDRSLSLLNLNVRSYNVFANMEVSTVRDLAALTRAKLLDQRNFGEGSCKDVVNTLMESIKQGPPGLESIQGDRNSGSSTEEEPGLAAKESGLVPSMWGTLQSLRIRDASFITRRLGVHTPPETLKQIAATLGLSQEDVNQLENEAFKNFFRKALWLTLMDTKIRSLRQKLDSPVALHRTHELDPWFDGINEYAPVIKRIIRKQKGSKLHIIEIDGTQYFAFIAQGHWDHIAIEARNLMARFNPLEITIENQRKKLSELLPEQAQEFSDSLWNTVRKHRRS